MNKDNYMAVILEGTTFVPKKVLDNNDAFQEIGRMLRADLSLYDRLKYYNNNETVGNFQQILELCRHNHEFRDEFRVAFNERIGVPNNWILTTDESGKSIYFLEGSTDLTNPDNIGYAKWLGDLPFFYKFSPTLSNYTDAFGNRVSFVLINLLKH